MQHLASSSPPVSLRIRPSFSITGELIFKVISFNALPPPDRGNMRTTAVVCFPSMMVAPFPRCCWTNELSRPLCSSLAWRYIAGRVTEPSLFRVIAKDKALPGSRASLQGRGRMFRAKAKQHRLRMDRRQLVSLRAAPHQQRKLCSIIPARTEENVWKTRLRRSVFGFSSRAFAAAC